PTVAEQVHIEKQSPGQPEADIFRCNIFSGAVRELTLNLLERLRISVNDKQALSHGFKRLLSAFQSKYNSTPTLSRGEAVPVPTVYLRGPLDVTAPWTVVIIIPRDRAQPARSHLAPQAIGAENGPWSLPLQ